MRVVSESIVRDRVRGKTLLMSERYSEIFSAHMSGTIARMRSQMLS